MHSPTRQSPMCSLDQWHGQIGTRRANPSLIRPFGALGILLRRRSNEYLINLRDLLLVVCHDEPGSRAWHPRLRLAGYIGNAIGGGVAWGGAEAIRFEKDFALEPQPERMSRRVDLGNVRLMTLGLQLDAMIDRACVDRPKADRLRLPPLWAGFRSAEADSIAGDGPEFDGARHRYGASPTDLMHSARREHDGLALFPLDWVSHALEQAATVFVDLRSFRRRQVFRLDNPTDDLIGFRGACQFDFVSSRFNGRGARTHSHSAR